MNSEKTLLNKSRLFLMSVCLIFITMTQTVHAVMYEWEGPSSVGDPVSFTADLSISGNFLTIVLTNTSPNSINPVPSDLLSSFYFDIENETGQNPTLTYLSAVATGGIYLNDVLQTGINIKSNGNPGDITGGWAFKDTVDTSSPYLDFGIGTVGNNTSGLITDSRNQFNGLLVGNINYSIYSINETDIIHHKLKSEFLVKGTATFTFSGVSGFDNGDIGDVIFGLGTGPDSLVPVPATSLLGLIGFAVGGWKLRKSI